MAGLLRVAPYAVLIALTATGCASDRPAGPAPDPPASTVTPGATHDATPGATTTPVPTAAALDWAPVPGSMNDTVTVGDEWTLTVAADGTRAVLGGPRPLTIDAGAGRRIADALLDDRHALVVAQDRRESRPSLATVVDLATGETRTFDGDSDAPTTSGGTWALADDRAYYATVGGPGAPRGYCLAAADLTTGTTSALWCAPPREGFSNARVGADGVVSLLTFDDARPSCRTLVAFDGPEPAAYDGVPDCTGWEGVTLGGSRVWTTVPDESRIERAHAFAATAEGLVDLGEATSGSLLICAGAAYFARDAGGGEPASVLRWSPALGLEVAYRAPLAKEGFVVAPLRCGGDHLTLTALTTSGDEQATAVLR